MGKKSISTIIAISLGILLSSSTVFAQSNSLDIATSENLSIQNSSDIKSQNYSVQLAQNTVNQAKDAANEASTTLIINEQMLDLMSKPDKTPEEAAVVANYVPLTDDQIYQLIKVRDVQPLEAEYNLSSTKNNEDAIENSVKLNLYTQYVNLLGEQDDINTEQENIKDLSNSYNLSKLKFQLGVISESSYKKITTSYNNENSVLLQKQRAMDIAEMNLNKLMGQDIHTKYSYFSTEISDNSNNIESLDYYLNYEMENRTEIVNGKSYIKVKEKAYEIAKDRYPIEENLYNRQAKYDLEEAQDNLELKKASIEKDIRNQYNILSSKKKNIDNEMQSYNSAKKNYDIASNKYKLGVISKVDFESVELNYKKEEDKLLSLQRELWIEQFKIKCELNKGFYNTTQQNNAI